MDPNSSNNQDNLPNNFASSVSVSAERIRARARELAQIAGRRPRYVTPADIEQARRELTVGEKPNAKDALLESAPESQRWNPVPGSPGHQAPESPNEDENKAGEGVTERLVKEGVEEAEHDQMVQAAREAEKRDRHES